MEDLLYRFLRLDPDVVKRYSNGERSLLQFYAVIVLIGSMAALGIWCTGLSYLFNSFIAVFGVLPAYGIWLNDTTLLKTKGLRPMAGRLASGIILSIFTTICLGAVVYYQTAVHEAEQEAEYTRLEAREKANQRLDAYRITVEQKYQVEIDRIEKYYNSKIDRLLQEQLKSAKAYSASGVKKANSAAQPRDAIENGASAYQEPNKAEQYVDTVIQKQIDLLKEDRNSEKQKIYDRIEQEVEAARQTIFYAPDIKTDLTLGNIWGKISRTAFDEEDTSKLSLTGIIYMICLLLEFFPFVIRVIALPFTKFIKENTD